MDVNLRGIITLERPELAVIIWNFAIYHLDIWINKIDMHWISGIKIKKKF